MHACANTCTKIFSYKQALVTKKPAACVHKQTYAGPNLCCTILIIDNNCYFQALADAVAD